jgi:hypothetical protein
LELPLVPRLSIANNPSFWKAVAIRFLLRVRYNFLVGRFVHFRIDGNLFTVFINDSFPFLAHPAASDRRYDTTRYDSHRHSDNIQTYDTDTIVIDSSIDFA